MALARAEPPRVLVHTWPDYPADALAAGIEGVVVLQVTVNRYGRVTRVDVQNRVALSLDAAAVAAVRQWRFAPVTGEDQPAPGPFRVPVRFIIQPAAEASHPAPARNGLPFSVWVPRPSVLVGRAAEAAARALRRVPE